MARGITQPFEVAQLKGADKKDPQRYRGVIPKSKAPLGEPPARLSEKEKEIWYELMDEIIPGVLTKSERPLFTKACELEAEWRENPRAMTTSKLAQLINIYREFGCGAISRQKLATSKVKEENPYDAYI